MYSSGVLPVAVDTLIRALADRASPNNSHHPVKFNSFANQAYKRTEQGEKAELALGEWASQERQRCRQFYDKYKKRAQRSCRPLGVPSNYTYWSYLEKTDELVILLNSPSSSSHSNAHSRSLSPKRSPIKTPTRKTSTSKSLSPKRSFIKTPTMSEKEANYNDMYDRLLGDCNSHAVCFGSGWSNPSGILASEQTQVEIAPGVYRTKGLIFCELASQEQAVHANPAIAGNGRVISIWQPHHHPLLAAATDIGIDTALNKFLGEDPSRNAAIDITLGSMEGQGVELHDVCIGGTNIHNVPFVQHKLYMPPDVIVSNKDFNPEASKLGDDGLDYKLVLITDFHKKNPSAIIQELVRVAPDNATASSAFLSGGQEAKDILFEDASKKFLGYQLAVNTQLYLCIQFTIEGDQALGKKSQKKKNVTDLISSFSISG